MVAASALSSGAGGTAISGVPFGGTKASTHLPSSWKTCVVVVWSHAPLPRPAPLRRRSEIHAETPESTVVAKELKRRGFRFVGPTICYAFMQATGMVNDHLVDCFRYDECRALA